MQLNSSIIKLEQPKIQFPEVNYRIVLEVVWHGRIYKYCLELSSDLEMSPSYNNIVTNLP